MNTTTAAIEAGVTVATIRTWCARGIIAATKRAGRWIIDATSLTRRITIGKLKTRKETAMIQGIDRATFEAEAVKLGVTAPMKDGGCLGVHQEEQLHPGAIDNPYHRLLVARGAAVATGKFNFSQMHRPHPHECHTCGLDTRTCDCR